MVFTPPKNQAAPAKKHYVYILESSDARYYVGYTTDLTRRMQEHESGHGSKFTGAFGFKKLLYHETFADRSQAMKREAEIKKWPLAKKTALIRKDSSDPA